MAFAALDFFPANFIRSNGLLLGGRAARDECGGAFEKMKDIGVARVNLGDAWAIAPTGLDLELAGFEHRSALGESGGDFVALDECHAVHRLLRAGNGY